MPTITPQEISYLWIMDRFIQRSRPSPGSGTRTPLASGSGNSSKRPDPDLLGPPTKKSRLEEVKDSDNEDDDVLSEDSPAAGSGEPDDSENLSTPRKVIFDQQEEIDPLNLAPRPGHGTAFESCLPDVATDKEAIEQYETLRASQSSQDGTDTAAIRLGSRHWVPGKNSIYVDAFNLALETVLEDESHLFDAKERHVFDQWKRLSYEAQYL